MTVTATPTVTGTHAGMRRRGADVAGFGLG